ncbi:MAG: hypothetical protein NT011_13775 [Kiritimatiellaeota bacterium]|nr:hypothetical protein [Kiritimatiellota bacterium]
MNTRYITSIFVAAFLFSHNVFAAKPAQLTFGPGNDTEAVWSPDGKHIAFQSDRDGRLRIYLLALADGSLRALETGPGESCFPCFSPDGKSIVYSYSYLTKTAFEGIKDGYNIYIIPAEGGNPRQLTSGSCYDYLPTFSPDGNTVYFCTTRGLESDNSGGDCVSIFSVPVAGGQPVGIKTGGAFVQPSFSPNGKFFAIGSALGARSNWRIEIAKVDNPSQTIRLTDPKTPFYGPRWAPKGEFIACTGYTAGQDGWEVWLLEIRGDRQRIRVTNGHGNSCSPFWSPDGSQLVFESNATGSYKLYRIPVPEEAGKKIGKTSKEAEGFSLSIPRVTATINPKRAPLAISGDITEDVSAWQCVGLNQSLEVQLPQPQTVSRMRIYSGFLSVYKFPSGEGSIKGCRVQALNGKEWQDLFSEVTNAPRYKGEGAGNFFQEQTFKPVTADRFRLIITASNDTRCRFTSPDPSKISVPEDKVVTYIRKFELFNTEGKNVLQPF